MKWKIMLEKEELDKIQKEIEREFSNDFASQQVHIARKIINKEAHRLGISYTDYIKQVYRDKTRITNE